MKYVVTAAGNDKGEIYEVEVLAKKINGVWTKWHNSIAFVAYEFIRVLEMTDEEKAMPIYMKPGYPGKEW